MVTPRPSDVPESAHVAPVVKRKRRASCLGEQERRERKRAIDREAQRSLREKTKTHIAELERTIRILRDQDGNGSTASLLSEIESLRAENERLRDIIEGVKSVVGGELMPRTTQVTIGNGDRNRNQASPSASAGQPSPNTRRSSPSCGQSVEKPPAHLLSPPQDVMQNASCLDFDTAAPKVPQRVDLDGMVISETVYATTPCTPLDSNLDSQLVAQASVSDQVDTLHRPDSPSTAAFAPFITEIFGSGYRCPSPTVLHIDHLPVTASSNSPSMCPTWKKSNELFSKIFSYQPNTTSTAPNHSESIETGYLFLGIKNGWSDFDAWQQSPVLSILKNVDEFLFANSPPLQRLAVAYKNYKLLKYYLNSTKADLEKVPKWLRPSISQSLTIHPIAMDFCAWPTLRSRVLAAHATFFKCSDLLHCYSHYLRFDWPFSFEDTFFYDETIDAWQPSPLFDHYHNNLKRWGMDEAFLKKFPEVRGAVESDWRMFGEVH